MYQQFTLSKSHPSSSKTIVPYPGQHEFMYIQPQTTEAPVVPPSHKKFQGQPLNPQHLACASLTTSLVKDHSLVGGELSTSPSNQQRMAQASFHTFNSANMNMSTSKRPMVIHTKMMTNNTIHPSSSPSSSSKSAMSTLQPFSNINNMCEKSSTISNSSDDSKEKYKRPCPSESYRNIAATLTLDEISRHYHLTRQDACTALKVSWRDLKERLNVLGVSRWPKTNAKRVTQFNTTTSHFEQLCSVIETAQSSKNKQKIQGMSTLTLNTVQSSHQIKQQRSNKNVKVSISFEKNQCSSLSPKNSSTCSFSCPSIPSNIVSVQHPSAHARFDPGMCSPKKKAPKPPQYYPPSSNCCNQMPTTLSIQEKSVHNQHTVYPINMSMSSEMIHHPKQDEVLPHISSFLEEVPPHIPPFKQPTLFTDSQVTTYVQYPKTHQEHTILPSIRSFDTFISYQDHQNNLKRGRVEIDDLTLNKKRII